VVIEAGVVVYFGEYSFAFPNWSLGMREKEKMLRRHKACGYEKWVSFKNLSGLQGIYFL
jgi:hypothetical protein